MSDEHEHDPAAPAPPAADGAPADDVTAAAQDGRPDPRLRPPDPAGTQPLWDPEELLPKSTPRAASGRLWAPEAERAETEGETDRETVAAPATPDTAPVVDDDRDHRHPPYSGRFQFLLGALLAVGASAIVLLVASLVADDAGKGGTVTLKSGPAWSTWKPRNPPGLEAAQEIASHVGKQYDLPNGQQLVGVTATAMEYGGLPVTIAIQQPPAQGGSVDFVDGTGVWFHMCDMHASDKSHCAIQYGKPSVSRHMLLRREALELALYSFRYLGVSEVVVSLPPAQRRATTAKGQTQTVQGDPQALLFRRSQGDVQAALDHQLTATLSTRTPTVSSVTRWPDARAVRTLTDRRVFNFRLQPGNAEPRAFLVLTPLAVR